MIKPPYEKSVFINCPFDDEYAHLLQTIVFTLFIFDFTPRSALELDDGSNRLDKILNIIGGCKYGIHDISRTELDNENKLPRFNMPFELGIDLGQKCLAEKGTDYADKILLILDIEKHRFRKFLSDISGQDIREHNNDPHKLISAVRNWLRVSSEHLPSASFVISEYETFNEQFPKICSSLNLDTENNSFVDYCHIVKTWLEERKAAVS